MISLPTYFALLATFSLLGIALRHVRLRARSAHLAAWRIESAQIARDDAQALVMPLFPLIVVHVPLICSGNFVSLWIAQIEWPSWKYPVTLISFVACCVGMVVYADRWRIRRALLVELARSLSRRSTWDLDRRSEWEGYLRAAGRFLMAARWFDVPDWRTEAVREAITRRAEQPTERADRVLGAISPILLGVATGDYPRAGLGPLEAREKRGSRASEVLAATSAVATLVGVALAAFGSFG